MSKVSEAFERCIKKFKELENLPIIFVIDRDWYQEVRRPDWREIFRDE